MSSDIWGHVNVPSPYGMRYCLLVIDHHTHAIWVMRFLKSKDDACHEPRSSSKYFAYKRYSLATLRAVVGIS
jgi:hypothetical protein